MHSLTHFCTQLLNAIISRLCINHLQSARLQREEYFGQWLPEPLVTDSSADPSAALTMDESLSMGFLPSYMGGAIAAHLGHGEPVYQPAFVLALLLIGAYLGHPEILWSLNLSTGTGSQAAKQASQHAALRQI